MKVRERITTPHMRYPIIVGIFLPHLLIMGAVREQPGVSINPESTMQRKGSELQVVPLRLKPQYTSDEMKRLTVRANVTSLILGVLKRGRREESLLATKVCQGVLVCVEGWKRLGQVRLGQIRLGQVRLDQVRFGQVRLG